MCSSPSQVAPVTLIGVDGGFSDRRMERMVCKSAIVAGALFVIAVAASPASAITVGPHSKAPIATEDLAQPVQYGYCSRWRRECADRWGWRTPRFYICLERRGCAR